MLAVRICWFVLGDRKALPSRLISLEIQVAERLDFTLHKFTPIVGGV